MTARSPETSPEPTRYPKLGLLFLTVADLNHPGIWTKFIEQGKDDLRVFSHSKEPPTQSLLLDSAVGDRIPTRWGHISLVTAMLALLRPAFRDESLTHFAFASESCIPVKPWEYMREMLACDPRSMISISDGFEMPQPHAARHLNARNIPYAHWRFHSQWVLLDREAVGLLLQADLTKQFECVFAADEHYFGTSLSLMGFPRGKINPAALTWVDWKRGTPARFDEIDAGLSETLRAFPGFFARKFSPGIAFEAVEQLWNSCVFPDSRVPAEFGKKLVNLTQPVVRNA